MSFEEQLPDEGFTDEEEAEGLAEHEETLRLEGEAYFKELIFLEDSDDLPSAA